MNSFFGHVSTPSSIVDSMVNIIEKNIHCDEKIKVLEPGCGNCPFLRKILKLIPNATLTGIEINEKFIELSEKEKEKINIIIADYLLQDFDEKFDVIIGNPPYGIPSNDKHYKLKVNDDVKKIYKKRFVTWFGKYNLYGAFIEKSISSLKENGKLIFVLPGTFLFLSEFVKLRKYLSLNGETNVYYLGKNVFGKEANVSVVVLFFIKSTKNKNRITLLNFNDSSIVNSNLNWNGEDIAFQTEKTKKMEEDSFLLKDLFEVRISPRVTEIRKNGAIFREEKENCLPILNSKNLLHETINYDKNYSGFYVKKEETLEIKKIYDAPRLVLSMNPKNDGRYAIAFDEKNYAWMGDVYHLVLKKEKCYLRNKIENKIIKYFYEEDVNQYIRDKYRDITYHLSKSQIEKIPIKKSLLN